MLIQNIHLKRVPGNTPARKEVKRKIGALSLTVYGSVINDLKSLEIKSVSKTANYRQFFCLAFSGIDNAYRYKGKKEKPN